MVKENIRRVTIAGVHKVDIVMYLALILTRLGFRVLVCDRTSFRELKVCIKRPAKELGLVRYQEIDFAFSELVSLDEEYDYIFYVQDFLMFSEYQDKQVIYVCDGIRKHLELLIQELNRTKWSENRKITDSCMIIYRDLYGSYGADYVRKSCEWQLQDSQVMILRHECMDEAAYQRMQFAPILCLPEVSYQLETCLKELLHNRFGIEEKKIKQGMKMAKRGRHI